MAEITQIQVGTTTYDIRDSTAINLSYLNNNYYTTTEINTNFSNISNTTYIKQYGLETKYDTLNIQDGALRITYSDIDLNSVSTNVITKGPINFRDINGDQLASIRVSQDTENKVGIGLRGKGTDIFSGYVSSTNQISYEIGDPDAFKRALQLESNITLPISIEQGGTGATTSEGIANSHIHTTVQDAGNSSKTISFQYSGSGITTTAWFAGWDGYKLTAISAANTLSSIGALPLTGGTMTGTITFASEGYKTNNSAGYKIDNNGNFIHTTTNTGNYFNIKANDNTNKFSIYFETGQVNTYNKIVSQPNSGVNFIQGCAGNSALYVKKKTLNTDQYIPGLTIQTKSGGGWAIGNYNDERLTFTYGTSTNITNNNNSSNNYYLDTSGNFTGNAATATKLATARTLLINLSSGTKASFDGSENVNIGVSGILPISYGGTGQDDKSSISITRNTGNTSAGTFTAYKWGNIVIIRGIGIKLKSAASGDGTEIGSFSSNPPGNSANACAWGGNSAHNGLVWVTTAGKIVAFSPLKANANINFTITYFI